MERPPTSGFERGLASNEVLGLARVHHTNASRDHRIFVFVRSKNGAKMDSKATRPLSTIGP
jgi:hypothetical protein